MPIFQLSRTNSSNENFQALIIDLNALLRILDGDEHAFYAALNTTDTIGQVIVAYENDIAVGCGALRTYKAGTVEIKRMFVSNAHRGKGIASAILQGLELWAKDLGFKKSNTRNRIQTSGGHPVISKAGLQNHSQFWQVQWRGQQYLF